ncbi:MAG: helix-turn-helix transcriptional regulator [Chloroflexota bacterium]|nr:helix-turn-helix transcriptional regulator [Chloroflexota bacterium]MDE2941553.1 helix-turn-helix transcriptional regulator [Chloroflexota bacterium]
MKRRQPSSRVKLNPHAVWERLNRRNMTQNELAGLLDTSSGYLSQLISGTRRPSAAFRKKLMEALWVTDFDDIFILEDVE